MLRSLAISVGIHGVLVAVMALGAHLAFPAPPIPIELMAVAHREITDVGDGQHQPTPTPPPAPAPKPPSAPARPPRAGASAKPAPAPPPPSKTPPPTADLRPYAPAEANLVVLLHTSLVRGSPYRDAAELLLSLLPDHATLLDGTGLSAVDDFDALLIATADPRDIASTFLAARFRDDERVRALAHRPLMAGDPRQFRYPAPGLAVLAPPAMAARLDDSSDPVARARWLAQLGRLDQPVPLDQLARLEHHETATPAALQVTLADLPLLMRFGGGVPTPRSLAFAMTAEASPFLHLKLTCGTQADAEAFVAVWPDIMQRYRSATALLGLGGALDGLRITRTAPTTVEVSGRIPAAQLQLALVWLKPLLQRPNASPPRDGGTP